MILISSCASDKYSVAAYKAIGVELKRKYKLSRSDLIVAYDLANIDHSNCIYSADLGTIINKPKYKYKYLSSFASHYKSPFYLQTEARKKIIRIYKLLLRIQHDYKVLSNNEYQYVKKLAKSDITNIDLRKELSNLDKIISFVPILLPVKVTNISSKYGYRKHPIKKVQSFHCGMDMVANSNSLVYAAANGIVVFAGCKNGYGQVVEVQHAPNLKTLYAHLKHISVKKGNAIARGKIIGIQGKTGDATNEHLHFEILLNNKHVNPYDFISDECSCRKL